MDTVGSRSQEGDSEHDQGYVWIHLSSQQNPLEQIGSRMAPRSGAGPFSHPPAPLCSIGASLGSGEGHITPDPVSIAGL